MTDEEFLRTLDSMAAAPEGVAQVRRLILRLAIQGRLVSSGADNAPSPTAALASSGNGAATREAKERDHRDTLSAVDDHGRDRPYALPAAWSWVPLGAVVDIGARGIAAADELQGDLWVLDLEDVARDSGAVHQRFTAHERPARSSKARFRRGDVLFGKLRPYLNKVVVADDDGCCTTEMLVLTPKDSLLAGFLAVSLRAPDFVEWATAATHGVKMPRLGTKLLRSRTIALPPLDEQERIVNRVGALLSLCDEIEEKQRQARAQRAATARSALAAIVESDRSDAERAVRLVEEHVRQCLAPGEGALDVLGEVRGAVLDLAVRGRLLPAAREQESALDSPGGMHRPDGPASVRPERGTAASDSRAGTQVPFSAPAGWAWTTIGDVADIENGDRGRNYPSKHTLVEAGVPFVNAGHLAGGRVQIDRADFITEEHFSRLARGRFKRGDVLFCLRGSLGKCGLVDVEAEGAIASSLVILRPTGLILARYLLIFLESHAGRAEVSAYNNGTAQPNLASKDLARFRIPVPPLEVQQQVVDRVDELRALSDRLGAALESERALAASLAESVCAAARSM